MLIQGFLQLTPGVFMIFYHYISGKYSKTKTSDLALFFIFGVETMTALVFMSIYFIICTLSSTPINFSSDIFAWLLAGILAALSFATFFCYFRRGAGTKLFISRRQARNFINNSTAVKSRSDAFTLGFVSGIPELIFTLPLYLLAVIEIMYLGTTPLSRSALVITYVLVAILPLLIIYIYYRTHHNLADLTRFRTRSKPFFRFFLSLLYLLLAILIIIFKVTL